MPDYPKLMRLTNFGASLITEEFLADPDAGPISDPEAVEPLDIDVPLAEFKRVADEVMGQFESDPPSGDATLAVAVHRTLKIPRRTAMDVRTWHFLTCVAVPEYVRYRWGGSGKVTRERFLGSIKRNAFARLWWAAEVMRTEDDYSKVEPCFEDQDLYEAVFGRAFSKFPPAAKAFVDAVRDQERKIVRVVAKDFNFMLSTLVLEDLSEQRVGSLVGERVTVRACA